MELGLHGIYMVHALQAAQVERWRVIALSLPRTAVPSIAEQEVALTTKIVTDFYCVPADSFKTLLLIQ